MASSLPDDPGQKTYFRGTHRLRSPAETLSRVGPLDAFGITRIANVTGLDRIGLPVVAVYRPNARSSAVFHGKGLDIASAKASGIMEAIETWHAEHIDLQLRFGGVADLRRRHTLVDTEALPRCPGSQFHPDLRLFWAEGTDLMSQRRILVPFEIIHADGTMPVLPGSGCFASSTNGLASGNHFLEAVSHGLCEIIERDASSLWNQMPVKQRDARRIDLSTMADETCRELLVRFERARLDVAVWETTTDLSVPAFQCIATDRTEEVPHIAYGAGCHPTRDVALLRALTEAAQVRMTYIVGSREDIRYSDYQPQSLKQKFIAARRLIQSGGPLRGFASVSTHTFSTFREEIDWLLDRVRSVGLEQVAVVDLTREEFGINVTRVVVPGLEGSDHHDFYVPGPRANRMMERGA